MDEQSIFLEALQKETPEERAAFLVEACGNEEGVRREVDLLLRAHAKVGDFLQRTPAGFENTIDEHSGGNGDTPIGPYKIREKLVEGGMGVVYVAEQSQPVRRKVALKVIKPGMATKDVVARFEAERQALAMMDHPNIARVFDGGATESGQPYFVMELVQGLPINKYCDSHQLDIRQRLDLFVKVCRAVQHAHQKGIIHRDLKPSNVLVARIDDEAVPKVIDFGIAKAINHKLSEQTVYTQFSQMIGTPLYMSPEQTELGVIDIDTRSDVYSLGAMLYELLTGRPPFNPETLNAAGYDEMRRIIREQEPPRPSAMVSTLKAAASSTIAKRRQRDSRKLSESLRGELDWIVMKALEKDRNRRYESASALATDIGHFLNGEAVSACRPTLTYRLTKAAKKHRVMMFSLSMVALGILATVLGTSWQAIRATKAEAKADKALAEANASLDDAVNVIDRMVMRAGDPTLRQTPDTNAVRKELLADALDLYLDLLKEHDQNKHLLLRSLHGMREMSSIMSAFGDQLGAIAVERLAIEKLDDLVMRTPDDPVLLAELANCNADVAEIYCWDLVDRNSAEPYAKNARRLLDRVLDKWRDADVDLHKARRNAIVIADVLSGKGQRDDAVRFLETACEDAQRLADAFPDDIQYQVTCGILLNSLGVNLSDSPRNTEAENVLRRSLAIFQSISALDRKYKPHLSRAYSHLGRMYESENRVSEAEKCYLEAMRVSEELRKEFPSDMALWNSYLFAAAHRAKFLRSQQRDSEAEAAYVTLWSDTKQLFNEFPHWTGRFVDRSEQLAELMDNSGRRSQAVAVLDEAQATIGKALQQARENKTAYYEYLARQQRLSGSMKSAFDLRDQIFEEDIENQLAKLERELLRALTNLVEMEWSAHAAELINGLEPTSAEASIGLARLLLTHANPQIRNIPRALRLATRAVELMPNDSSLLNTLGVAQYRAQQYDAAIKSLTQSQETANEIGRAYNLFFLAMAHYQLANREQALTEYRQALRLFQNNTPNNEELKSFEKEAKELLGLEPRPPAPD